MITTTYKTIAQWTVTVLGVAALSTTGYWWTRSGNYEAACDEAAIMYGCLERSISVGNPSYFVDSTPYDSGASNTVTNAQQWVYGFMPPSLPPGAWITYQSDTTTTYYASVADASGNLWSTLAAGAPQPFTSGSPGEFSYDAPDYNPEIFIDARYQQVGVFNNVGYALWSGSLGNGADGTYTLPIVSSYSSDPSYTPPTNSTITVTFSHVDAVTPNAVTNIHWNSYSTIYSNQTLTNMVGFYPQVERYAAFLRANALYSSAWLAPSNTFFSGGSWDGHFGPAPPLLANNTTLWTNSVASNTTYGTFAFERDSATNLPYISTNALDDLARSITLMQWQQAGSARWKTLSAKRYTWDVQWNRNAYGEDPGFPDSVYHFDTSWTYSNSADVVSDLVIGTNALAGNIAPDTPPQIFWGAQVADAWWAYSYPDHEDQRERVEYTFSITVINSQLVFSNGLPFDIESGRVWAGGGTGGPTNGLDEIGWALNYPGWAMDPTNYFIITPDDWTCAASNSVTFNFPLGEGGIESYVSSLWGAANFPTDQPTNVPFLNLFSGGYPVQPFNPSAVPPWHYYEQDPHNYGGSWSMGDPRINATPRVQYHIRFPSDPDFNDWRWSAPR